jgi:hypothetical protein
MDHSVRFLLKSGWNEGFERLEGALLGYENWENDYHIEHFFRKAKKLDSTVWSDGGGIVVKNSTWHAHCADYGNCTDLVAL